MYSAIASCIIPLGLDRVGANCVVVNLKLGDFDAWGEEIVCCYGLFKLIGDDC